MEKTEFNTVLHIEEFDNGITMKQYTVDCANTEKECLMKVIATNDDKERAIGAVIWDDVTAMMDEQLTSKVKMTIKYEVE